MVEVGILGPVAATVAGRPVRLGPQQRALLAVLALEAGRMLPTGRLAEMLWGDPVPESARGTLRSHILHLRRSLEPGRGRGAGAGVVVTAPGGYLLGVEPQQIDAVRFEHQLAAGRQALAAGRHVEAAETVRAALTLWRGPALCDVADRPFALAAATRLDGLRQAALRVRIEADLALGRHREITGELRAMLAADPLDEELRRLLVLALYRGDRQEEAARVCQDGVVLLQDRGLDPGRLRGLQEAVLRGASELAARPLSTGPTVPGLPPAVSPGVLPGARPGARAGVQAGVQAESSAARRPFQLPPDVPEFTGRDTELALLAERLGNGAPILAIDGPPGIGKSSLANHLAHRLAATFTDGVLYVNLRGAEPQRAEPLAVLGQFLRTLGVDDPSVAVDVGTATAVYRSLLADRRMLVVLDNAGDAAQIRPLLPSGPDCAALVTSRSSLSELDGVRAIRLELLGRADAVTLLGRFAGTERILADPNAAERIAQRCGLLPLALRIAGARLRARPHWTLADFADRLDDAGRRLAELAVGDLAVRSSFELSYQALEPLQRSVFRLMGLLDGPEVGVEVAAVLCGVEAADTAVILEQLADAQLVESLGAGRYRFHDLMRLFARERSEVEDPPAERRAAVERTFTWYLENTIGCHRLLLSPTMQRLLPSPPEAVASPAPFASREAAVSWLDIERANLISAVQQAALDAEESVARVAWELSAALVPFLPLRSSYADCETVIGASASAARRFGNAAAEADALSRLGQIHRLQGRYADATECLGRSLTLTRALGDRRREGLTLMYLGSVHGDLGTGEVAVGELLQSLALAAELADPLLEALTLENLGVAYHALDRTDEAADCLERGIELYRQIGGRHGEAETLADLAAVRFAQRRYAEAATAYTQSLELCRAMGNAHGEASALEGLGRVAAQEHRLRDAREHWAAALAILAGLGIPKADDLRALLETSDT